MESLARIPIDMIDPNPDQPRKHFDSEKLKELAESIRQDGLQQPIKVRPSGGGKFAIMMGERRWRACQELGMKEILAIVEDQETCQRISDGKVSLEVLALVENLHRENLNPLEEAEAFKNLVSCGLSIRKLAQRIGKSAAYVSERIGLLEMGEQPRQLLLSGQINYSQARQLSREKDPETAARLTEAAKGGATVRQMVQQGGGKPEQPESHVAPKARTPKDQPSSRRTKERRASIQDDRSVEDKRGDQDDGGTDRGAGGQVTSGNNWVREALELIGEASGKLRQAPAEDGNGERVENAIRLLQAATSELDRVRVVVADSTR